MKLLVNISIHDQIEITIKTLCDLYDWKLAYHIEDDIVYEDVSWICEHTHRVRPASEEDKMVYSIIKRLRTIK